MAHTETQRVVERLMDAVKNGFRGQATADDMREAASLITRQQEEIARYRERLEVDYFFKLVDGDMVRVECPEDDLPDGIECRDVTIHELDLQIERLTKERLECQIQAGDRADDIHRISERYYKLLYAATNLRKGMTGHHVNAEDLYCFDTALAALQAKQQEIEQLRGDEMTDREMARMKREKGMSEAITNGHSLERTSPKGSGQKFIGTCRLCGKAGLTFADMATECENQRGLTQGEALLEAIEQEPTT